MKLNKTLIGLVTGALAVVSAQAQVELVLTGSTAFRAIAIDRAFSIFDATGFSGITNDPSSPNLVTYRGTVQGAVPSLGTTPVTLRLGFSGSGSGMLAVKNLTPVLVADTAGSLTSGNINKTPDIAFSDIYPASATPPIAGTAFERSVLGVIPFVYVRSAALTGVNSITREQAYLLMTASGSIAGIDGMPATYLGGSSAAPVYLIGRDSGSGTRITVHKDVGFNGNPTLWATNGAGAYVLTNGYSSGSNVRNVVKGKSDAIAWLGLSDALQIVTNGFASMMAYQGVPYSEPAVANGAYTLWGYEHVVNRAGALSANQVKVRNALIYAITNATFQSTYLYTNANVRLNQMNVQRGADGAPPTSLNF